MYKANAKKFRELVHRVSEMDDIKTGVAKARLASEANYSVPSLERCMRGELVSEDVRVGTLRAAKLRGLSHLETELFVPVNSAQSAS